MIDEADIRYIDVSQSVHVTGIEDICHRLDQIIVLLTKPSIKRKLPPKLTTDEFLASLKAMRAYRHINIDHEYDMAIDAINGTKNKRGQLLTERFFLNWLKNVPVPMDVTSTLVALSSGGRFRC